jgi:hypothetical protein
VKFQAIVGHSEAIPHIATCFQILPSTWLPESMVPLESPRSRAGQGKITAESGKQFVIAAVRIPLKGLARDDPNVQTHRSPFFVLLALFRRSVALTLRTGAEFSSRFSGTNRRHGRGASWHSPLPGQLHSQKLSTSIALENSAMPKTNIEPSSREIRNPLSPTSDLFASISKKSA